MYPHIPSRVCAHLLVHRYVCALALNRRCHGTSFPLPCHPREKRNRECCEHISRVLVLRCLKPLFHFVVIDALLRIVLTVAGCWAIGLIFPFKNDVLVWFLVPLNNVVFICIGLVLVTNWRFLMLRIPLRCVLQFPCPALPQTGGPFERKWIKRIMRDMQSMLGVAIVVQWPSSSVASTPSAYAVPPYFFAFAPTDHSCSTRFEAHLHTRTQLVQHG